MKKRNKRMMERKKSATSLVLLLMLATVLAACGGSSATSTAADTAAAEAAEEEAAYAQPMESQVNGLSTWQSSTDAGEGSNKTEPVDTTRKLIRTVDMTVETESYDELMAALERQISELGGYIEYKEAYHGSQYSGGTRNAHLTVRIPADKLAEFTSRVKTTGNVIRESESTEDVTLTYVDLDSHKTMLQTEQERLLAMLEQAQTMEEIIALESRLSEVRYQIESMESQLRTYDNLVEYSTVNLYIEEVERYTPQPEVGTWDRIGSGFSENVYRVGNGIKNFFIELIIALPLLAVCAVVIGIIIILVRFLIKWEKKRSKAAWEKRQAIREQMDSQAPTPLIKQTNKPAERETGNTKKE